MTPPLDRDRTARTLIAVALVMAALFGLLHALGWRSDVAFFSGTWSDDGQRELSLVRGVSYVLGYLGFVVVAPTLAIAAILLEIERRIRHRLDACPWRDEATPHENFLSEDLNGDRARNMRR